VDAQSFVCLLWFISPKFGVPNLVHIATRNKRGGMLQKKMMAPLRSKYMSNKFSQERELYVHIGDLYVEMFLVLMKCRFLK
jgi:hypothetical protein